MLSYLQEIVDEGAPPGFFVLTGSQNLGLLEAVTQTLAGRLLPLGLDEVRRFSTPPQDLWTIIWKGGYPRIYDQGLHAREWLANYTATYVERDVRHVLNIGDLLTFQTFLRLCAGRTGQLLNLSGLGADAGVTHATSRSWISVLEASYIVFRLRPFYRNIGKRLVKTPKVYFYDSGLLCYLLGIREPEQLETHPLRGPVLECWVISEIVKHRAPWKEAQYFLLPRPQRFGNRFDCRPRTGLDCCRNQVRPDGILGLLVLPGKTDSAVERGRSDGAPYRERRRLRWGVFAKAESGPIFAVAGGGFLSLGMKIQKGKIRG